MKIGRLELASPVFLAPMAGVADAPFRRVCRKYFSGACVTEMVSAKAVCYGDKKTKQLAEFSDTERPIGIQIFGSEPGIMSEAAMTLTELYNPDFIDINMGCPAPKIVNNGEGSALMKNEVLAGKIVEAVKRKIGDTPLTVKMRAGFDAKNINAPSLARVCEENGADAVFIHARTREQMYAPSANPEIIRLVKQGLKIPVIGNGDVTCADDAIRLMEYTGCDGVMVGRACLGNPYVLNRVECGILGGEPVKVTAEVKLCDMKEHIRLLIECKGEYVGVREARKHVAWYIKGMPGAAEMRNRVNCAETRDEVMEIMENAFKNTVSFPDFPQN